MEAAVQSAHAVDLPGNPAQIRHIQGAGKLHLPGGFGRRGAKQIRKCRCSAPLTLNLESPSRGIGVQRLERHQIIVDLHIAGN